MASQKPGHFKLVRSSSVDGARGKELKTLECILLADGPTAFIGGRFGGCADGEMPRIDYSWATILSRHLPHMLYVALSSWAHGICHLTSCPAGS